MYTRIYILKFPKDIVDQPIICQRRWNGMQVICRGHKENIQKGLTYLKGLDVKAESVATSIHRDEDRCFQCGACTGICPTAALSIKRPEMAIIFDAEKCSGCGLCVTVCPVKAMEVSLDRISGFSEAAFEVH